MAVDMVNAVLVLKAPDEDDPGPSSNADVWEEDEDDDEEMFEEEDEIDDMMALDQYQDGQRKDLLVRKNLTAPNDCHKKGNIDVGGSRSS